MLICVAGVTKFNLYKIYQTKTVTSDNISWAIYTQLKITPFLYIYKLIDYTINAPPSGKKP